MNMNHAKTYQFCTLLYDSNHFSFLTGNRWKSTSFIEFGYDDEIYGLETRPSIENL